MLDGIELGNLLSEHAEEPVAAPRTNERGASGCKRQAVEGSEKRLSGLANSRASGGSPLRRTREGTP